VGSRRGDEGDPGDRRPVEPEEAQAHGSDPDDVRIRERGDAAETARGTGSGAEREAAGKGEGSGAVRRVDRGRADPGAASGDPRGPEEGRRDPATGWVEESATRLLGAFYDLSGGRPGEEVPLGGDGVPEGRGAAQEAGIDPDSVPGSVERDVAVRYLLNMGYVQKGAATGPASYAISATGIERVRRMRGLPVVGQSSQGGGRSGMSEKTQTRLLSLLTVAIFLGLNRQVKKFIDEQIPERRGVEDDLLEAALQGAARLAAVVAASVLVRRLAGSRR
jgi:hypothetical protein